MSLTKKTISATKWSAALSIVSQPINLIISILLARLLVPSDYGLIAIVLTIIGIIRMFQDLGTGAALVQKQEIDNEHINSAFWFMVIVGIILFLILSALSPLIANFYQNQQLLLIMICVASGFLLTPLYTVHQRLLEKRLELKKISIATITATFITGICAIIIAFYGGGVWSLVFNTIAVYFFTLIMIWRFEKWRPKLTFNWKKCKELLSFGINLSLAKIVGYLRQNIIFLILGKTLGADTNGVYKLGDRLVAKPLDNIVGLFSRALFSSYSVVQNENHRLQKGYLTTLKYLCFVAFPASLGLVIVAPELIPVVLGEKWLATIPIVQILGITAIFNVLININFNVCFAKGKAKTIFYWNIIALALTILVILFTAKQNIVAVAIGLLLLTIPLFISLQIFTNRLMELSWWKYLSNLTKTTLFSLVMLSSIYIFKQFLIDETWSIKFILIMEIMIGIISYSILNIIFNKNLLKEGLRLFKNKDV